MKERADNKLYKRWEREAKEKRGLRRKKRRKQNIPARAPMEAHARMSPDLWDRLSS